MSIAELVDKEVDFIESWEIREETEADNLEKRQKRRDSKTWGYVPLNSSDISKGLMLYADIIFLPKGGVFKGRKIADSYLVSKKQLPAIRRYGRKIAQMEKEFAQRFPDLEKLQIPIDPKTSRPVAGFRDSPEYIASEAKYAEWRRCFEEFYSKQIQPLVVAQNKYILRKDMIILVTDVGNEELYKGAVINPYKLPRGIVMMKPRGQE